jgi:hypothetical protein
MKHINKFFLLSFLAVTLFASGCSEGKLFGKKSNCGCPSKKGLVGY